MSTDTSLSAEEVLRTYSLRFKIEVGFKSAIHTLGTYSYRFWMKEMKKTRYGDGTKYLHKETEKYRESYLKKLKAFHVYIQIGLIAQGLMQYLSMKFPEQILRSQGGWIRAIRPCVLPSEWVVSMSLRNCFDFLLVKNNYPNFEKFLKEKTNIFKKFKYQDTG